MEVQTVIIWVMLLNKHTQKSNRVSSENGLPCCVFDYLLMDETLKDGNVWEQKRVWPEITFGKVFRESA